MIATDDLREKKRKAVSAQQAEVMMNQSFAHDISEKREECELQ